MKKFLALLLTICLMTGITACGNKEDDIERMEPEELLKFAEENLSATAPSMASELMLDGATYSVIEHGEYKSKTLDRTRGYNIMLPPGYDASDKSTKYPVLYALHGYWGDEYSLLDRGDSSIKCREVYGNLLSEGKAVPMIIVFPDIFCHETKEDCDGMNDENNKAYDNFINELQNDLMPYIESHYNVLKGRKNTAITGFSMGGRESLYIGCALSDKFGYIGAVCPAPGLTPDCLSEEEMSFSEENTPYLLMISAGDNDTVVYSNPENYHNIFTRNGVDHIWHMVPGGAHGGNTIRPHLYNFLQFIFKEPTGNSSDAAGIGSAEPAAE